MTIDNTLLGEITQETPEKEPIAQGPEVTQEQYFDTYVGDGKKYVDGNQLAKAYSHAERHIRDLTAELQEKADQKDLLDNILNEVRSQEGITEEAPPQAQAPEAQSTPPVLRPEDVESTIHNVLEARDAAQTQKDNRSRSYELLAEEFGDIEAGKQFVKSLVLSDPSLTELINQIGDTNPDAFIKLVKAQRITTPVTNTPGIEKAQGAPSVAPGGSLTWERCQEIRKEDPLLYNSAEFRTRIEQAVTAAEAQGRDFFKS